MWKHHPFDPSDQYRCDILCLVETLLTPSIAFRMLCLQINVEFSLLSCCPYTLSVHLFASIITLSSIPSLASFSTVQLPWGPSRRGAAKADTTRQIGAGQLLVCTTVVSSITPVLSPRTLRPTNRRPPITTAPPLLAFVMLFRFFGDCLVLFAHLHYGFVEIRVFGFTPRILYVSSDCLNQCLYSVMCSWLCQLASVCKYLLLRWLFFIAFLFRFEMRQGVLCLKKCGVGQHFSFSLKTASHTRF